MIMYFIFATVFTLAIVPDDENCHIEPMVGSMEAGCGGPYFDYLKSRMYHFLFPFRFIFSLWTRCDTVHGLISTVTWPNNASTSFLLLYFL